MQHHIQKAIIYDLAFSEQLRFSELKPDDIESKLFTYHLKILVSEGLVEKSEEGQYSLTTEGRWIGAGAYKKIGEIRQMAYSSLFLVVTNKNGQILLVKRKAQPLIDTVGLPHAIPSPTDKIEVSAAKSFASNTGVNTAFTFIGSGYFRIYEGDALQSFSSFSALKATTDTSEIKQLDERSEYYWADRSTVLNTPILLPTARKILDKISDGNRFFIDSTFNI